MDKITVAAINFDEVRRAFADVPDLAFKYCNTAMLPFGRRVAHQTKSDYLHGGSGIKGGPWARIKDKNIRGFTAGTELGTLRSVTKVSKLVKTHVEGAVITAKAGGFLFLSKKIASNRTGRSGKIFARLRSVTLPARIPFEAVWQSNLPRGEKETDNALHRAMDQALRQRMKMVSSIVNTLAEN